VSAVDVEAEANRIEELDDNLVLPAATADLIECNDCGERGGDLTDGDMQYDATQHAHYCPSCYAALLAWYAAGEPVVSTVSEAA